MIHDTSHLLWVGIAYVVGIIIGRMFSKKQNHD